ncbi:MAG: diguanylate cyclase [Proteobacteria bacterium]|nr:diguanylate cyclase [Pseudomonadota bacterium]
MRTSEADATATEGLHLERLRLRFRDATLEQQFLLSHRAAARLMVRVSLVVALSSVLGFAIIDHLLLLGAHLTKPDLWRFALQLPLVVLMLALTDRRLYQRWYPSAVQVVAPLFGIGTLLMAAEAAPAQLPVVAARLLLTAFYIYFMIGLSFGAALRTNLLLLAVYAGAALLGLIPQSMVLYSLLVLGSANVIGAAGCYALEYASRLAFLERRRLAEAAMHDGLTGLLNRAALEEQARHLWQHAREDGLPVAVLLIDIDHFKAFNDCYGHQAGDRCLQAVAGAISQAAPRRPLDIVARYGGEEIIAILVGGGRDQAVLAAERVLRAVADLGIAHAGSATRPQLSVSVGVSSVEPGGEYSHDRAVRRADIALYVRKARGRDGWSFHGESDEIPEVLLPQFLKTAS